MYLQLLSQINWIVNSIELEPPRDMATTDTLCVVQGMQAIRTANLFMYQLGDTYDTYSCAKLEFTVDAGYFAIYYLSLT